MKIDVVTLFPAMFAGPLDESIIMRARKKGLLDLAIHDLRQWTHDRHKTVDDRPFGGGPGMLMKPEPVFEAVESLRRENTKVILLSPGGRKFSQQIARELGSSYSLGYTPSATADDSQYHRIEVRVNDPNLKTRQSRDGYGGAR